MSCGSFAVLFTFPPSASLSLPAAPTSSSSVLWGSAGPSQRGTQTYTVDVADSRFWRGRGLHCLSHGSRGGGVSTSYLTVLEGAGSPLTVSQSWKGRGLHCLSHSPGGGGVSTSCLTHGSGGAGSPTSSHEGKMVCSGPSLESRARLAYSGLSWHEELLSFPVLNPSSLGRFLW